MRANPRQLVLLDEEEADRANRWREQNLVRNPFETQDDGTPLFRAHVPDAVYLAGWLKRALSEQAVPPLVIKGAIGNGKTHWLRAFEHDARVRLGEHGVVSYRHLTEVSMKNLSLGGLMWSSLSELAREVIAAGGKSGLEPSSPIAAVLSRVSHQDGAAVDLAHRWLARGPLSKTDLSKIGASGPLETEGQWVAALADILLAARERLDFKVWLFLLDQLEDLWRSNVITPVKRARFLTDLRALIDRGRAGSPLAIALAWNTGQRREVEDQLKRDYIALFSRVERVVDIPKLPREQLVPFARAYVVDAMDDREEGSPLLAALEQAEVGLTNDLPPDGTTAREWLKRLHAWAEQPVWSPKPRTLRLKR